MLPLKVACEMGTLKGIASLALRSTRTQLTQCERDRIKESTIRQASSAPLPVRGAVDRGHHGSPISPPQNSIPGELPLKLPLLEVQLQPLASSSSGCPAVPQPMGSSAARKETLPEGTLRKPSGSQEVRHVCVCVCVQMCV